MQTQQITKITKETFEEIFHPTGAKIVSYSEGMLGGYTTYEIEVAHWELSIGSIQLARLGYKGLSIHSMAIVPRGNKQVFNIEFMETCDYITVCKDTAKSCGDI